eukprot:1758094-Amphidinium_carterae.1
MSWKPSRELTPHFESCSCTGKIWLFGDAATGTDRVIATNVEARTSCDHLHTSSGCIPSPWTEGHFAAVAKCMPTWDVLLLQECSRLQNSNTTTSLSLDGHTSRSPKLHHPPQTLKLSCCQHTYRLDFSRVDSHDATILPVRAAGPAIEAALKRSQTIQKSQQLLTTVSVYLSHSGHGYAPWSSAGVSSNVQ